jgi:hypothetical protein
MDTIFLRYPPHFKRLSGVVKKRMLFIGSLNFSGAITTGTYGSGC